MRGDYTFSDVCGPVDKDGETPGLPLSAMVARPITAWECQLAEEHSGALLYIYIYIYI